jgi:transcriptional regulator with XRE-family HTH domain
MGATVTYSCKTFKIFPMTKDIALHRIFGNNLKMYRNQRRLSQRKLYNLCGIDHAMICRMENGQGNVTLKTLSTLAEALDIPCWRLLISNDEEQTNYR